MRISHLKFDMIVMFLLEVMNKLWKKHFGLNIYINDHFEENLSSHVI